MPQLDIFLRWCMSAIHSFQYGPRRLKKMTLDERFSVVYRLRSWSGWDLRFPHSGAGSTVQATQGVREWITRRIAERIPRESALRILDAPCGDMTWMPTLLAQLAQHYARIEYIGVDIVPDIVAANARLPAPALNVTMTFICADITRDPLPKVDIILCKDLVNHLSYRDCKCLLQKIESSQSRFAIITSNAGYNNQELDLRSPGASRFLDLEKPPFDLTAPISSDGYLALWELPFHRHDGQHFAPPRSA